VNYAWVTVACIILALSIGVTAKVPFFKGEFGPSTEQFPHGAIKAFNDNECFDPAQPCSIMAPPEWGGFIAFYTRAWVKPMMDDRNMLVGKGLAMETEPKW